MVEKPFINWDKYMAEQKAKDERINELQTENELIKGLIKMALDELGVPNKDYPAPVANAVDFLKEALKG